MYLSKYAYPAAKELLQSRIGFRAGIGKLIDQCRADFDSPFWDELAACDFDGELERFSKWWPRIGKKGAPSDRVEVLFLALEDVPYSITLRGSTVWSRDPDDWEWWYHDDYSGPRFMSQVMDFAFERSELCDLAQPVRKRRGRDFAGNAYEVVEMFFSLGYYGLLLRELLRNLDPAQFLGKRSDRWFTIGHPDAVYGIIVGRLTRSRWHTFHG